jgi:hypothetical protein
LQRYLCFISSFLHSSGVNCAIFRDLNSLKLQELYLLSHLNYLKTHPSLHLILSVILDFCHCQPAFHVKNLISMARLHLSQQSLQIFYLGLTNQQCLFCFLSSFQKYPCCLFLESNFWNYSFNLNW